MPRHEESTAATTKEKGSKHDDLMPLLVAMFREFQEASKKKPDAALNKRKAIQHNAQNNLGPPSFLRISAPRTSAR